MISGTTGTFAVVPSAHGAPTRSSTVTVGPPSGPGSGVSWSSGTCSTIGTRMVRPFIFSGFPTATCNGSELAGLPKSSALSTALPPLGVAGGVEDVLPRPPLEAGPVHLHLHAVRLVVAAALGREAQPVERARVGDGGLEHRQPPGVEEGAATR